MKYIDMRSDTVTRPSRPMLEAMMSAEVGDDVFGEDPTVNKLQARVAEMFGKEAALFVPSGTMGNEICIKAHTEPGDEIIVDVDSHVFVYETAGPSLLSGVQMNPLSGTEGTFTTGQLKQTVRPNAYYMPKTRLICLENTHGRSGGTVVPIGRMKEISDFARDANLKVHLDGARIWNASVASGISVKEYAKYADSISACFSKGLGAPVGSIIVGTNEFIDRCRKFRKIFGGGMRQCGILAAAAIYALDHNIDRLAEDHGKARVIAEGLARVKAFDIQLTAVQTNMVIIDIQRTGKSQSELLSLLHSKGILLTPERQSCVRAVMHLDVSLEEVKQAVAVIQSMFP